MNILGQEKLISKLSSYTYKTFPKSSLILGEQGSGKHLIASFISKKLELDLIDITENISQEMIDDIAMRVIPTIYLIDASKITERHQNIILKFLEEPTEYTYILILSDDRVNLLSTVLNRCVIFELEQYKKEVLETFIDKDIDKDMALSICRTPGQLKALTMINLSDLHELCVKMMSKLSVASYSNTLTISDKLNYKDEYNKFDVTLFFNMLIHVLFTEYKNTSDDKIFSMYLTTVKFCKKLRDKRLNKKHLVENFLSTLWQEVRV